jgi:uncharacterized protein involved in exopolysaccharide biosynthesis
VRRSLTEPTNGAGWYPYKQSQQTGAHCDKVMIDPDSGREAWPTKRPTSMQRAVLRKAWLIPACALLVAFLAYVVDARHRPTYTAVGQIYLAAGVPVSGQPTEDIARTGATQATMLTSNVVIRDAEKAANLPMGSLRDRVAAVYAKEASYITLSVTARTAKDAALWTVAVERAYERASLTQRQAQYLAIRNSLQDQIATVTTDLVNVQKGLQTAPSDARLNAQQTSLTKQLTDATDKMSEAALAANSVGTGVGLFAPPDTPSVPTSPKPILTAIIGLLLGALLGSLLAWLLARLGERGAAPTLATLGLRRLGELGGDEIGSDSATADAALSVLLELPPGGQVIALLSTAGSPTTVASGFELAASLDADGQSAAVVDGIPQEISALEESGRGRDATERPGATEYQAADGRTAGLWVVPSSVLGVPMWPNDVDNLIRQLRVSFQFIFVATGPLSRPESRLLLSRADVGVLVLNDGVASLAAPEVAWLRRLSTPLVGYIARHPARGGEPTRSGVRRIGGKPVTGSSPATRSDERREVLSSHRQD